MISRFVHDNKIKHVENVQGGNIDCIGLWLYY